MNDDELDHMLSRQEDIVPSSGLVPNVMDAVRREASAQPPIPFPWKWAMPALAAWALALASLSVITFAQLRRGPAPAVPISPLVATILGGAKAIGAEWIALALVVWFASVTFAMRLAGSRT
jgi:hypothetical protein